MPPWSGTAMIPPPPLFPPNQQKSDGVSAIDTHSGDIGQYFGTFGPPHQHHFEFSASSKRGKNTCEFLFARIFSISKIISRHRFTFPKKYTPKSVRHFPSCENQRCWILKTPPWMGVTARLT
mmetsp:Transcript_24661/g.28405  ORF Transcript_24661/g.28405 Transcript_24661/m.28405 type:complete len:122 (-) Transcript_24661:238-603(-)